MRAATMAIPAAMATTSAPTRSRCACTGIAARKSYAWKRSEADRRKRKSARLTEDGFAAGEAFRRPQLRRVVIRFEHFRRLAGGGARAVTRQFHPRLFRARVDVHVGRQRTRLVERADAHKANLLAPAIVAPQRGAAIGAAMDDVRPAGVGRLREAARVAFQKLHAIALDQRVEHEG